ncbi:MAG: M4 family metallopeptidase [Arenimonas sp.]|nr:M4 family metallopeptidase [Arenimonas sp.]
MIHSNRRSLQLITLSPLTLALAMVSAQAATRVDLHSQNVALLNSQYKLAAATGAPTKASDRHAEMLGLDSDSSLQVLTHNTDPNGTQHYRYQQSFRGFPIWGEQVIVSEDKGGNVRNLFGRMVGNLGSELQAGGAVMAKSRALSIAKSVALGNRATSMKSERESARQMIYIGDDKRAHMSYVVSFFADSLQGGSPTRPFVIMDAVSGKVLKKWDGLTTSLVGTGPGGNGKTGQYEWGSGGKYGYLDVTQSGTTCTMNNANVKAVNLNGGTTGTTAFSYTCPRNTVKTINGGYSPLNDAMQFGGVITSMYPAYTGYNALTFQLVMRTHYSASYENAFWDGATMSFGDGASTFYPLVNADVSGHEVSHGFTEQHSNLTYSGQSGGMNEAFSDMGGEATEYYWQGSNDFLVGAEIFKGSGALRYMSNPPQDGGSIDNAANFTSSMDVHYSSGVYNKAFWKLATTSGWDVPKAFKVFTRANALYWTASSTFNSGACGVETAATDLGFTKADVTAAFTLVGVSCSGGGGGGTTTALTNGVAKTGIAAATGAYAKYTLVVPAGATGLKFVMSGGTGDADMYVKFGSAPTDTVYDCRPYASGNAETCTIATAQAGTYYINLKAYAAFSGASLTGSYTTGATNTAPTANFTSSVSGLTATFTDSSTDPQGNGTITSRSWTFGDGTTSTATSPVKTYAAAGTYTVTETVTDSGGLTGTKSASVTVAATSCGGTVLCSGTAVALPSVAKNGVSSNYTIVVPAGKTSVVFTLSGGTGDADMYVKLGSAPTSTSYGCRPYLAGNAETCTFNAPTAGTYYVNVRAYAAYSGVSLKGTISP